MKRMKADWGLLCRLKVFDHIFSKTKTAGTSSATQYLTLTNTRSETPSISSIGLTGADTSIFSFANTCGATLAASAICATHGHFAPTRSPWMGKRKRLSGYLMRYSIYRKYFVGCLASPHDRSLANTNSHLHLIRAQLLFDRLHLLF
jgi:hypothetical protein